MLIWKVKFDWEFRSSSGMEKYTVLHKDVDGYVLTIGDSLQEVQKAIASSLDNQSHLTALHTAVFVGYSMNEPK